MANHLFIGLGGTGASVLCALRKRIYEEFRKLQPDGNVFLEYLYVDSSEKDLNDRSRWKILGTSVHLDDVQKVNIHGMGSSVLDDLHDYPGIESFINPEDRILCNDLGSLISDGIGGQRRRLGRMLFANNVGGPQAQSFNARLKDRVQNLVNQNNDQQVTFHICAGLAGGTGSGTIIDVISQIRKEYDPQLVPPGTYKIMLYLYVPEVPIVNPACEAGFYHSNGYASLMELNAASIGAYHPTDVTGKNLDDLGQVKRLLYNCDAFESAYLYTNVNEKGKQLRVGDELSTSVADFIFQKTVASAQISTGQLQRIESCENVGTTPEIDEAGNPVRSRRFMSFGIKRIEYPENEIKEYVAYNFAAQAVNQLHYNKWVGGIGFDVVGENEVGNGFQAIIQNKKERERLLLSDAVLTLSRPIDSTDKTTAKWKEINVAWEEWTRFFSETTMNEEEKAQWLNSLSRKVAQQYDTGYRGLGVKPFYEAYRKHLGGYASFIRRHIEGVLFNEWLSGQKSILEVQRFVALLNDDCENRIGKFNENKAKCDELVAGEIALDVAKYEREWDETGWLKGTVFQASAKIFDKYRSALCAKYSYMTKSEGYQYASELMMAIVNELVELKSVVDDFAKELMEMSETVVAKAEAKCKTTDESTMKDAKVVKKYDPESIRSTTKRFFVDKNIQMGNAAQIRKGLVDLLGEESCSFSRLYENVSDVDSFEDMMLNICMKNGESVMAAFAKTDPNSKMSGVNVLEKIKLEYNTSEKLDAFVRELYNSAQNFIQFAPAEMSGSKAGNGMMKMVQLCLPVYNDPTNFRQKFIQSFANVCAGYQFNQNTDVCDNYKENQIVVIAAASGFPLRFVANVAALKTKYDAMTTTDANARLNKMVLHTESFKKPLPPLFNLGASDMGKMLRPYLIKAFAMGLIIKRENPDTGEKYFALELKDQDGFTSYLNIGKDIVQALSFLSSRQKDADTLMKQVDKVISEKYIHNNDKADLKTAIVSLLNTQVLPLFNNNDQNMEYQRFLLDAKNIIRTELKEN